MSVLARRQWRRMAAAIGSSLFVGVGLVAAVVGLSDSREDDRLTAADLAARVESSGRIPVVLPVELPDGYHLQALHEHGRQDPSSSLDGAWLADFARYQMEAGGGGDADGVVVCVGAEDHPQPIVELCPNASGNRPIVERSYLGYDVIISFYYVPSSEDLAFWSNVPLTIEPSDVNWLQD